MARKLIFRHEQGRSWIEQPGRYSCLCDREGWNPTTLIFSCGNWQHDPIFIHPEDMGGGDRKSLCYDCGNEVKIY